MWSKSAAPVAWTILAMGGCTAGARETGGAPAPADAAGAPDTGGQAADGGAPEPGDGGGDHVTAPSTTGKLIVPEISGAMSTACATRTRDGWCWADPQPQGALLADVSSTRAGEMWAVGVGGAVLRGTVRGTGPVVWTLVDVGLAANLTAVSASTDGAVFVGSDAGDIVRGDAATGGWTRLAPSGLAHVKGLWAASATEVWAVGGEPTVRHWTSVDGWTATDVGPDAVTAVVGRGADDVWMATEIGHSVHWDGNAFTAGDIAVQGRSYYPWDTKHDLYFSRMGLLADGTIWAAATSHNSDGAAWALSAGAWSSANAYTMAGDSLADHWADGIMGHAVHVSPYGPDAANETMLGDFAVLAGRTSDLWAIAGSSARHGAHGSWDPATTMFAESGDVRVAPNGDVWVTGLDARTWRFLAVRWDGARWSQFPMPDVNAPGVVACSGGDVWIANTSLWHWNGDVLEELPYPTTSPFPSAPYWYARRVLAVEGAVWVIGNDPQAGGSALLRTDGKSWRSVPLPDGYDPHVDDPGLGGTSDRDLWLVSGRTIYHYDGQAWSAPTLLPGGAGIRDLVALAPDDVWAPPLHFDGASWTATAAPGSFGGIYSVWAGAPDDVWTSTENGLFHWDGRGWSGALPIPTPGFWFGLAGTRGGDLWITGWEGTAHGRPELPAAP